MPWTSLNVGTDKFISRGVAHDGLEYLYMNRNNGRQAKGGLA